MQRGVMILVAAVGIAVMIFLVVSGPPALEIRDVRQSADYGDQAIGTGPLKLEIHGAPRANMPAEDIARLLPVPDWFSERKTELLPEGAGGPSAGDRLVLTFNGADSPTDALCRAGPDQAAEAQDGPYTLVAAYCDPASIVTQGALSAQSLADRSDQDFVRDMQGFMDQLFPKPEKSGETGAASASDPLKASDPAKSAEPASEK